MTEKSPLDEFIEDRIKLLHIGFLGFPFSGSNIDDFLSETIRFAVKKHADAEKVEYLIDIERKKMESCENDKINSSYHMGWIHCLQGIKLASDKWRGV